MRHARKHGSNWPSTAAPASAKLLGSAAGGRGHLFALGASSADGHDARRSSPRIDFEIICPRSEVVADSGQTEHSHMNLASTRATRCRKVVG
jgi:hypothetical protein